MPIVCLHEKQRIEAFLRRDPLLHVYELGDLDEFYWPYTTWYGLEEDGTLLALALFYTGLTLPVLLAYARDPWDAPRRLLEGLVPRLPPRFYAHLSGDLARVFAARYDLHSRGVHCRMALRNPSALQSVDTAGVERLTMAELPEVDALYREAYPDTWFEPSMLRTGLYFGLRRDGRLVSVGGVHVHSPAYRVSALGNVATHPRWRGRGLAKAVCARLCLVLKDSSDAIGLNVKADNQSAIACYRSLGFERVADYGEYDLGWRAPAGQGDDARE